MPHEANVKIEVFNLLGQKIETLINKTIPAGSQEIEFIANSLGFYTRRGIKKVTNDWVTNRNYDWISIRGNLSCIPTKVNHKKLHDAYYPIRYNGTRLDIEELKYST